MLNHPFAFLKGSPRFLLCAAGITLSPTSSGQDHNGAPPPQTSFRKLDAKLVAPLAEIPKVERQNPGKAALAKFRSRAAGSGLTIRDDQKVLVEIIAPDGGNLDRDLGLRALEALGLEVGRKFDPKDAKPGKRSHPLSRTDGRAEAWLPVAVIERMESLLPVGYRVVPVLPLNTDDVTGEGPGVVNSTGYNVAFAGGAGLTIAIVDGGFAGLAAARANGDIPAAASTTETNLAAGAFESGTSTHGTECVEVAFDNAPNATYRLYRFDSPTDYNAIVTDCIANGVDIISHSVSQYNLGWADDTGVACDEANRAAQNGIIFMTAAGNRALSHYQGQFADTDNDGWHEFPGGDESIDLQIGMTSGTPPVNIGGPFYLSWSNPSSDFDFYLYDSTGTNIIAQSATAAAGTFEQFNYSTASALATFRLMVMRRAGSSDSQIEIFSHNSAIWSEHAVAEGSTTSPGNATHARVISVAAVPQSLYDQPAGANVIANYSSRGPTNDGRSVPDISGPTDSTVFSSPGVPFNGTSCATPNTAGALAAFWSADLTLNADAILWLVKTQAGLFRDWGTVGTDRTYGAGGIRLMTYKAGTRWLVRNYPGTLDDGTVPFHTALGVQSHVPNGGRILVFGDYHGTFPELIQLGNVNKTYTIETVPGTGQAVFGN
jgi:hypothetical protein